MATSWAGVNNMSDVLAVANTNTGGWFWVTMLFMVFIVLSASMVAFGIEAAVLAAAFGTLVIGLLFAYMGLVGWGWILMLVGIIVGIFLWISYKSF